MDMRLLEFHPHELQFIFELKKICSSSIQLTNNAQNHVAFKVKTTFPKKYCVRPNMGIIEPKSTCEINIRMQPQVRAPPNMICKDKFLIQSTIVPSWTTDEDITSAMFAKDGDKYIEEKKLVTTLVSPSSSSTVEALKEEEMVVGVSNSSNDKEDLKMIKHVEELKLKVTELELKLSQAQVTISELEEEKRRTKFLQKNRVTLCAIL